MTRDLQSLIDEPDRSGVAQIDRVDLVFDPDAVWNYARENAAAIDARWSETVAANPKLFNGPILMMCDAHVADECFHGRFLRTDFKSFMYWRAAGEPPADVFDAFGSALVWSADGRLMLARQSAGHINAGLLYMPGGFIDLRDIDANGTVDILGSVARELEEETGLGPADLTRRDGFTVTVHGPNQVSIGVRYDSSAPAEALRARILGFIDADPDPELADVVFRATAEPDPYYPFAPYAQLVATAVLSMRD